MRKEKKKDKTGSKKEEEEASMIDDVDKDKDYNPDDDLEADFVTEDQDIEDEDTFEVEKHIHAINIVEAGEYLVTMRRYMDAFEKIVHRGKSDVSREYKKLIHFVKLMIDKLGAYSPIEAGDVDAVYNTMKVKSKTERADVVKMVKKYFRHIVKAHEEATAAA